MVDGQLLRGVSGVHRWAGTRSWRQYGHALDSCCHGCRGIYDPVASSALAGSALSLAAVGYASRRVRRSRRDGDDNVNWRSWPEAVFGAVGHIFRIADVCASRSSSTCRRSTQSETLRQPTAKPFSTSMPTPIAATLPPAIHETLYVSSAFSMMRSYSSENSPLS